MLASAISAVGVWVPSIWSDEAATISASTRSWGELVSLLGHLDAVHGAYYAIMHLWFSVVGVSPLTLRLPSIVFVGVSAAGLVVLGRMLRDARTGLFAGIIFAVLPRVTWMAVEGRSSALTAAVAVWLTVLFVIARRRSGALLWTAYGAACAVSYLIWIFTVFVVVAHGVYILLSRRRRRLLVPWAISVAASVLVIVPFLLRIRGQSGQVSWIPKPGGWVVKSFLVDQWFGTDGLIDAPLALVCWAGIVATVVLVTRRRGSDPWAASTLQLAIPWILIPPFALIALSLVSSPVYTPKYVAFATPAVALVLGLGITIFGAWWMRIIAVALIAALALPAYLSERTMTAKDGSDWARVASTVTAERGATDAVIYLDLPRTPGRAIAVAYPSAFDTLTDVGLDRTAADLDRLWGTDRPLSKTIDRLTESDRVWLISDHADDVETAEAALADAGYVVERAWKGTQTDLTLLQRH